MAGKHRNGLKSCARFYLVINESQFGIYFACYFPNYIIYRNWTVTRQSEDEYFTTIFKGVTEDHYSFTDGSFAVEQMMSHCGIERHALSRAYLVKASIDIILITRSRSIYYIVKVPTLEYLNK